MTGDSGSARPILTMAGMPVPEIARWVQAGRGVIPGRRLALLALAGFQPDDTLFDPDIYDVSEERLKIMAALNGHHIL